MPGRYFPLRYIHSLFTIPQRRTPDLISSRASLILRSPAAMAIQGSFLTGVRHCALTLWKYRSDN